MPCDISTFIKFVYWKTDSGSLQRPIPDIYENRILVLVTRWPSTRWYRRKIFAVNLAINHEARSPWATYMHCLFGSAPTWNALELHRKEVLEVNWSRATRQPSRSLWHHIHICLPSTMYELHEAMNSTAVGWLLSCSHRVCVTVTAYRPIRLSLACFSIALRQLNVSSRNALCDETPNVAYDVLTSRETVR